MEHVTEHVTGIKHHPDYNYNNTKTPTFSYKKYFGL